MVSVPSRRGQKFPQKSKERICLENRTCSVDHRHHPTPTTTSGSFTPEALYTTKAFYTRSFLVLQKVFNLHYMIYVNCMLYRIYSIWYMVDGAWFMWMYMYLYVYMYMYLYMYDLHVYRTCWSATVTQSISRTRRSSFEDKETSWKI